MCCTLAEVSVAGRTRSTLAVIATITVLTVGQFMTAALVNSLSTLVDVCTMQPVSRQLYIYTTTNFTRYSVTEVGALSAAGWAWSLHCKQTSVAGWAQRVGAPRLGSF